MNKVIVFLVAVFSMLSAYAAHDPEEYRVRVTKTDGTVIEGYTETNFLNTTFPKVAKFTFSTKYKGETTTYTSEDVKRVVFVNLAIDSIPLVFESVQAESKVPLTSSKTPKLFKTPVFLRLYYVGKNVKGYTLSHTNVTNTPNLSSVLYGWQYYYMING